MSKHQFRTWIEISQPAIRHNYHVFRSLIGRQTKLLGVVKSNAYGHELFGFASELQKLGVDFLGVDSITEALSLRREGLKTPILVLGYTLPENFAQAHQKNISLAISTFESLKILARQKKPISAHLKIDTGMHRQGFFVSDVPKVLSILKSAPQIKVDGVFTHFASAKRPDSSHETEKQIAEFKKAVGMVKKVYPKALAHASATAGALNYPEANFDMVRLGIGAYGLWPSAETKKMVSDTISLKPVLTWKTIISETKTVDKGHKVGYDYTEKLSKTTKLAVLPIGYWHGYWRAFSSKAYVLVRGQRCKLIGRVSMDMLAIDVTEVKNVKVGDEVVLIGKQGEEEITADELGKIADTSCYEIVTRLNPLIKKYYLPA